MKIAGYEIDGKLWASVNNGEVSVLLKGGPIVGISYELMEDADQTYIERIGDYIRFGQYRLRILVEDDAMKTIVCEVELN